MQRLVSSVLVWCCGVVILAAIAAIQLDIEGLHAPRVLAIGVLSEPLERRTSEMLRAQLAIAMEIAGSGPRQRIDRAGQS